MLIQKEKKLILSPRFIFKKNSKEEFKYQFCKCLFESLKVDPKFFEIFSSENLLYDTNHKIFVVKNSAFQFKYSNFKQLLFDFDIIQQHPDQIPFQFILNPQYRKILDDNVSSTIRKKEINPEELKEYLRLKQEHGEEAEKFVLTFENNRLKNNKTVEWVAAYIVNAGYDIASYNNVIDTQHSRFIEVKSYEGQTPYFFWSRNELLVAKQKRKSYWIYLVNRLHINEKNYQPLMIQDPYNSVLENPEWTKDVDNYRISLLSG